MQNMKFRRDVLLKDVRQSSPTLDESEPMIAAQPLPRFDPANSQADVLFGYDLLDESKTSQRPRRVVYSSLEPFDPSKHVTGQEKSSGNHGKDKDSRDRNKKRD